ncbi:MAG: pilin [Candidatus Andersenbacteria bacterium]|nr:pilin [Candidatus Andersenbacteria bacterium]
METRFKKIISSILILGLFFAIAPHITFAQGVGQSSSGITNPLGGGADQTITSVLTGIIKWMLGLVGFLALIALIIAGGRMIIDFGNEEQVRKAKMTITWAVIGLLVVILSYAIVNIVSTQILGAGGSSSGSGGSSVNPPPGT